MSYFSEALASHMDRMGWTNLNLSALTGLNDSDISRWKRGVGSPPSDKAISKMLPVLAPEVAIKLCICWLKDETPEEMREKILIQPVRIEDVPDLTREDWQQALEFFTRGCEHNPLLRQTLVGLHKLMTEHEAEDSAAARHDLALAAERPASYGGAGAGESDPGPGPVEEGQSDAMSTHLRKAAAAYVAKTEGKKAPVKVPQAKPVG